MRQYFIQMSALCLNDHSHTHATVKPVYSQTVVSQLAVEVFNDCILPGFAGLNEEIAKSLNRCRLHERHVDKLGAIVVSHDQWANALDD